MIVHLGWINTVHCAYRCRKSKETVGALKIVKLKKTNYENPIATYTLENYLELGIETKQQESKVPSLEKMVLNVETRISTEDQIIQQ
jgi:hypothetical protein